MHWFSRRKERRAAVAQHGFLLALDALAPPRDAEPAVRRPPSAPPAKPTLERLRVGASRRRATLMPRGEGGLGQQRAETSRTRADAASGLPPPLRARRRSPVLCLARLGLPLRAQTTRRARRAMSAFEDATDDELRRQPFRSSDFCRRNATCNVPRAVAVGLVSLPNAIARRHRPQLHTKRRMLPVADLASSPSSQPGAQVTRIGRPNGANARSSSQSSSVSFAPRGRTASTTSPGRDPPDPADLPLEPRTPRRTARPVRHDRQARRCAMTAEPLEEGRACPERTVESNDGIERPDPFQRRPSRDEDDRR